MVMVVWWAENSLWVSKTLRLDLVDLQKMEKREQEQDLTPSFV